MSTIRRVMGTLKNVTWVNVWIAGCEDVGTVTYLREETSAMCKACAVCDLKVKRCKVVLEASK